MNDVNSKRTIYKKIFSGLYNYKSILREEFFMFRLKELRVENGLKRSEFSKEIGLPASTIANYENETRQAPYKLLIAFADYFGVSVDYLLGRDNEENSGGSAVQIRGPLSAGEKKLIATYRECSPLSKNRIAEYAELLKKAQLE